MKFIWVNGDKMVSAEKRTFICEIFYTKLKLTIKYKCRAETQNIKQRKQKNIENNKTKTADRNTREKKQW